MVESPVFDRPARGMAPADSKALDFAAGEKAVQGPKEFRRPVKHSDAGKPHFKR